MDKNNTLDNKMQARNKFANKISQKIDKLNKDIQLLIQVDQVFKIQTGGVNGLLSTFADAIINKEIKYSGTPTVNTTKLKDDANKLAGELQTKIGTLETTLKSLIAALQKSQTVDLSKIDPIIVPTGAVLDNIKNNVHNDLNTVNSNVNKIIEFNKFYEDATTKEQYTDYMAKLNTFGFDQDKKLALTAAINKIRTSKTPILSQFTLNN